MQATSTKDYDTSTTPTTSSTVHDHLDVLGNVTHGVHPPDIEHAYVQDDPRQWSTRRKTFTLATIAMASLIATLGVNIYNPGINDVKRDLHATDQQISLSLSVFILVQGSVPLFWSAVSEIRGRKLVYLVSISLYLIGCGVAGSAKSMGVLIAMRVVQATGGSAVIAIGAATLADIYEPRERGMIVGIYYAAPLLGPSIGPLVGGVATQLFSWRATFFFLVIFAGLSLVTLAFFKDTFRRERSLSYQNALRRATKDHEEKLRVKEENARKWHSNDEKCDQVTACSSPDMEAQPERSHAALVGIRLSLRDINPIRPVGSVLKRYNNIAILLPSGLLFGLTYCITYTAVFTFAEAPYFYNSFKIGLVLLSFGIGCMVGSILGGRWSDYVLTKMKAANGGKSSSEDRLQSTKPMMLLLPPSLVAYAWMSEKKVHIAGLCVVLFLIGLSSIWIYSSTLAYIVDANVGRSSTAVATNSMFRGVTGFIAAEVAVPLQDSLGDGGLYTLWAGLMVIGLLSILLTIAKGAHWRELADEREKRLGEKA
ncbi:MFS general substrate transporter [Gautieria morchelliformis]|nr:MFS general substrate transporter [Gautieria morchelliformis]